MTRRTDRLNSLIRKEISDLLRDQINDPRLHGLLSITHVELSGDLKYAKIFVSTIGGDIDRATIKKGLTAATGFFRHELASRLTLRQVPEIKFHFDDSIEHAFKVMELIEKATAADEAISKHHHNED